MVAQLILLFACAVVCSGAMSAFARANAVEDKRELALQVKRILTVVALNAILWWGGWFNVFAR